MKAANQFLFLSVFILIVATFYGCTKNRGCTDAFAHNFDNTADKDNGSCVYSRTFWDDSIPTGGWIDVWVANIDTIPEDLIYEGRITINYPTVPGCNDAGLVFAPREPGNYYYEIENDKGNLSNGWLPFRIESCRMFEVDY